MINWRGEFIPSWNHSRGTDLLKGFVLGAIVTGVVGALLQPKISIGPLSTQKSDPVMLAKMDDLKETMVQLAAQRCMVVNTPVLSMAVYSTENVGVKKVPPPPKRPADAKRVALIETPPPALPPEPPKDEGSGSN
jgi:hypothetical protein